MSSFLHSSVLSSTSWAADVKKIITIINRLQTYSKHIVVLAQIAVLTWWWSKESCMWVNERLPGIHRGLEGGQDRAQGSIHNILQIEFDRDRPRGRVWPAENCGRVHSKSYWSVQGGGEEGVE